MLVLMARNIMGLLPTWIPNGWLLTLNGLVKLNQPKSKRRKKQLMRKLMRKKSRHLNR